MRKTVFQGNMVRVTECAEERQEVLRRYKVCEGEKERRDKDWKEQDNEKKKRRR